MERFVGEGVLVDLTGKPPRYEIQPGDLAGYAKEVRPGDFLVLDTGWDIHFGTPRFFEHPYFSKAAAELVASWGVSLVAVDGSSVDGAYGFAAVPNDPSITFEQALTYMEHDDVKNDAHGVFFAHDMLIVEYLNNLEKVPRGRGYFSFLPLRIEEADGSPIRAVYLGERPFL